MNVHDLLPLMRISVAAVLVAAVHAEASVVRCTAPDGSVTYQDSTCPKASRTQPVDETSSRGFRFAEPKDMERLRRERAAEKAREQREASYSGAATRGTRNSGAGDGGGGNSGGASRPKAARLPVNAGERRFITAGMPAMDVRIRIGAPDQVVRPTSSSRSSGKEALQRWVYLPAAEDPQTTTIVTVKGDVVTMVDRHVRR
jgi:hypothetical protein